MPTIPRHVLAAAVSVTLCAGLDRHLVAREVWYRAVERELFLHAWVLWACFAVAALPLVVGASWFLGKRRSGSPRAAAFGGTLGLWAFAVAAPVALHQALDSYIQIGGGLGPLAAPGPWLKGAAFVAVLAVVCLVVGGLARRAPRTVGGALTVGGVALGLVGSRAAADTSAASRAEAPADAPNLLLLVWDTARAKSFAMYGADRDVAPNLTALAGEAILFEEARSTSVFTLTSHLSMLTGTYPSHHGARLTRQLYDPVATPAIAKLLRGAGYRTGGFVGTSVLRGETGVSDGFEVYDDRVDPDVSFTRAWALVHDVQSLAASLFPALRANGRPHWFQDFQAPADGVLDAARAWIENGDDRPWFCFVNLYDVHWPYLPSEEARAKFVGPYDGSIDGFLFRSNAYERAPDATRGSALDADDDRHLTDLYESEFFDLDRKVDAFWSAVRSRSDGREIAAVITADHGEAFGEGERYEHDDILEPQVRVPLILVLPGSSAGAPGERRGGKASGVDVAPTLLSLAGLEQPAWMPGLDLSTARPTDRRVTLVEHRDRIARDWGRHAVYRDDWKLVVHGVAADGEVELFDLSVDPDGLVDVASAHPDVVEELWRALDDMRSSWGADGADSSAGDAPIADHLKALGYGG